MTQNKTLRFVHHEQQDVAGDGDVERLEAVDGGESRQLHQGVRISEEHQNITLLHVNIFNVDEFLMLRRGTFIRFLTYDAAQKDAEHIVMVPTAEPEQASKSRLFITLW